MLLYLAGRIERPHGRSPVQRSHIHGQISVLQRPRLPPSAIYLCRHGLPTFLTEKEALLTQGFEVEEDFIDAATPREAVEKYRSGFLYVADEIGKSDEAYAAATTLLEMGKKILGRKAG